MPVVSGSPSATMPSATATAGLTNVMASARFGPASRMSAKNSSRAATVHSSASRTTETTTGRLGSGSPASEGAAKGR